MRCPRCRGDQTRVVRTDKTGEEVSRLRECLSPNCRYVWKTTEATDPEYRQGPRRVG